jgi:dihydrofolate reductase
MTPPVALVVATARGGAIGRGNALPWRLPEDLKRFRALTLGHAIIMGRRTWDSIGRSLPGRTNIVISRDPSWCGDGARRAADLGDALAQALSAHPDQTAMVIGGAQVYGLALPHATVAHVTEIDLDVPGADAFFPALDPAHWTRADAEPGTAADGTTYRFVTYRRRV